MYFQYRVFSHELVRLVSQDNDCETAAKLPGHFGAQKTSPVEVELELEVFLCKHLLLFCMGPGNENENAVYNNKIKFFIKKEFTFKPKALALSSQMSHKISAKEILNEENSNCVIWRI